MFVTDNTSVTVQRHAMPRPASDRADALAALLAAILDAFVEQDPTITASELREGVDNFARALCAVLDRKEPGAGTSRRRRPACRRRP